MVHAAARIDKNWTHDGGDRLWRNGANWTDGVPTAVDKAAIRQGGEGPIIDSSTAALANVIVLSDWSSSADALDITGGSLTTNDWFILGYGSKNDGTFNVSGGATLIGGNLTVGFSGAGHIIMTGGTIEVNARFGIAQKAGASGDVVLNGGTISCASFSMLTSATMDIGGGTLIVNGDVADVITGYAGSEWIVAYGGLGDVSVDYNTTHPGKTTVVGIMSTEPPTKATNPIPQNGATGVSLTPFLSWSVGSGASSHDVFFGTSSPGTFRGNQAAGTFKPGVLELNTKYYWRIDEKNGAGTSTGNVWNFTTTADSSYSLIGKVMCGYQGWFNTPNDGTTRGWVHWGGGGDFSPTQCTVDLWPDMSEMSPDEKFLASNFNDGTDHYVFSSHNYQTVIRHFKWMRDYGIDGVYLQRFVTETSPGSAARGHRDDVLDYCKAGANLYNRKYAVMYDLSGLNSGSDIQRVINDWKYLVDTKQVGRDLSDSAYMTHNGQPVVSVWGLGFGRSYEGEASRDLIDFLKNDPTYGGNIVMLGVNEKWFAVKNTDTWFAATLEFGDIISPWRVGRPKNTSDVYNWANGKGKDDQAWCDANGKYYLPVIFPGFSWHNLKGAELNAIPRKGGQFLWDQVNACISNIGANMLYVAMFDEVDEGTAIFKVTNDPPTAPPAEFLSYSADGYTLPSDEYLWLVGQAALGLRGEIAVNQTRPVRTIEPTFGAFARGENLPNETADKAFDGDVNTKWLDFSPDGSWIQYQYADGATIVATTYAITSANDAPEKDPKDWNLLGSNDGGDTWDTLDSRSAQTFSSRFQTRNFTVKNPGAYNIYCLQITAVRDGSTANSVQIAEIAFLDSFPASVGGWILYE